MTEQANPFALVRASDYTDEQINELWVELGPAVINAIIEPQSRISKFILGGKGTGKTHLLRYHSYPVVRLRHPSTSGIAIVQKQGYVATFLRATGVDAARFEPGAEISIKWQQLFGVYLELRLVEGVLDALCDIKASSKASAFDDAAFIEELSGGVVGDALTALRSMSELREWVVRERRQIDDAVNNAAFSGTLELRVPFAIGTFALPVSRALGRWNPTLRGVPVIYLIDEIENFSDSQQQVVNSLIRYGEGLATFRVTGRRYAVKTQATLAGGEENREGAEFKTTSLDDILLGYGGYQKFARRFVIRRLESAGLLAAGGGVFDPRDCFEEISSSEFYAEAIAKLGLEDARPFFLKDFREVLRVGLGGQQAAARDASEVAEILTQGVPLLLQKLNLLLFCKKYKPKMSAITLASTIHASSVVYAADRAKRGFYATAFGHYASDLFAQLCRQSKKAPGVPYAGFDTFVRMSSGNPRNLLVVLGRAYAIAAFRGISFIDGTKLSLALQTEAAAEAARFMLEADTNFGSRADVARRAVERLALVLRTARFAQNIPEVAPLAVSFAEPELTTEAKRTLQSALNYSFVFEISEGRPDRNNQRVNKKIQLNPLLSPRWELPVSRRGDLGLTREMANAVFDPEQQKEFEAQLKLLEVKWNNPFRRAVYAPQQEQRALL